MPKCMTEEELAALYLAAEGSLNKNSKPTKEVICSLLVKMIPAIQWFTDGKSPAKGQPKKLVKVRSKKVVKAGKSKAPDVNRKPVKKSGPTPAVPEPNQAAPEDQDGTEKNKTVVDGQEDAEEGVGQNGGDGQVINLSANSTTLDAVSSANEEEWKESVPSVTQGPAGLLTEEAQ